MIVVAEDTDVWEKFPIPLINRLEKHYLGMETLLDQNQLTIVETLKKWIEEFAQVKFSMYKKGRQFTPQDVFIGYHNDALASIVLRASQDEFDVSEAVKKVLLNVAAPDAIARLSETRLDTKEAEVLCQMYYNSHFTTLGDAIKSAMNDEETTAIPLLFVTTQSRLLTKDGQDSLQKSLRIPVMILPLQQINTERQFREKVATFLDTEGPKILLVQAQLLNQNEGALIDCARYLIRNEINQRNVDKHNCCIAIVLQVSILILPTMSC